MNSIGWQLGKSKTYHTFRYCPLLLGHQYQRYLGKAITLTMKKLGELSLCVLCENKENNNRFLGGNYAI